MRTQTTTALFIAVFCASALAAPGQQTTDKESESRRKEASKTAYEAGKAEARRDIERGLLIQKTYGLPPRWRETYRDILRTKYDVEVKAVAGCVVTEELREGVKGYNEVAVAEIERRYGKGVLDQAAQDAREEYERKIGSKKQGKGSGLDFPL